MKGHGMSDLSDVMSTINGTDSTVARDAFPDKLIHVVAWQMRIVSTDEEYVPSLEDSIANDWRIIDCALDFKTAVKCLHQSTACNAGIVRERIESTPSVNTDILYLIANTRVLGSRNRQCVEISSNDILADNWRLVFYAQ
jgi:hypothetical protein